MALSELLAILFRVLLAALVLVVNHVPLFQGGAYFGDAVRRVDLGALSMLAVSAGLAVVLALFWLFRRYLGPVRLPRLLSFLLQLVDVAFVSSLLYVAQNKIRDTPYDILYFSVILVATVRFGLAGSMGISVLISGVYSWLILRLPMPGAFSTYAVRDTILVLRLTGFLSAGLIGGVMAVLMQRMRRGHEEERRRSREREVVLGVGSAISTTLDLDRLTDKIFVSLQDIILFSEGEITLWSGDDGCLISQSLYTPVGSVRREARYAPGESYSGWMAVHRQALWIPDVAAEKEVRPRSEVGFASHLGVPLLLGERLVGTLELSSHEKGAFSREDRDLLVATAPQIAAMLDHARLYDRVRRRLEQRVKQLSAIEQIDQELTATLDLGAIIASVLDRAMEFTGADSGALLGMAGSGDGLRVLAERGYGEALEPYRVSSWPLEQGIVGRVARTREPALVEDVSLDASYADLTGATCSELAVPICLEEEVLGVLNLESRVLAAFDHEALDFVQHLAEHAAIAIHNARIFASEQRRSRELAALQEVSLELSRKLEVGDILHSVTERAVLLLDATSSGLYTFDPGEGELEMAASHNLPARHVGTRLKLGEGLAGQVAQSREPRWVDDYRTFAGRADEYALAGFRAVVAVPLLYGDDLLGVLDVLHGAEGRTFGEEDLRILLPLANQAAVAIANARLFSETRRSAEQMALLQEVNSTLGRTLGFKETVEALIRGVQRLIPHSEGEVCLYDPERQIFTAEATLGEMARVASAATYTLEQGYTGWIGRNRRPLLIADCSSFTEVRPMREEAVDSGRLRSFLGVPMLIGDRLIGTLELIAGQRGAFGEEHLRLLTLVAGQAAVAIENARLYELTERRLRRRIQQLLGLQRIGQELNSTLLLEDNLQVILEEGLQATPSTHGNIAMFDETVNAFRVTSAYSGYDAEEGRLLRQLRLGRGRSMVDDALRSGQPEIVADAQSDPRPICVKKGARAALSVPVLYEGRVVGVINLRSTDPGVYSEEDLQFAQTLATQVSLAVGNARRYEELVQQRELVSQRATQLREILDIGNTLRADRQLPDILSQIAYGVVGSVGFGVVLFDLASEDSPTMLERVSSAGIPLEDFQQMQQALLSLESYRRLFREEFQISRSYFVPEEAGLTLGDGKPYLFPGLDLEQEFGPNEWHLQDLLLVPLYSSAGEMLGVMSVDNPFDRQRPTRRLVEALEIFANQAAIAVENARLFRERERRISELNVLNRISQATTSTLDLDAILLSIYERLQEARVLDVECFYIGIYSAERDNLRFYPIVDRGMLYRASVSRVEGMGGWVVRNRRPLLVADVQSAVERGLFEYVTLAGWEGEQPRSFLGVPMLVGEEIVGVIVAQSYTKGAYGGRDEQFLLTVANQVAVAIQNARLFREREQRLAELAILNEVGRALSSALELSELLDTVHQQVGRIFDTTNFYIATYEQETDEWTTVFHMEHGERQEPIRRKVGAGLTGHIIRSREPILLRNAEENLAFHEREGVQMIGEVAKSWLGVPLIAADKVVGVMGIQSYAEENLYTEQDLALFSTVAAQAAIAVDNARLFHERERRITELAILNEVGRALSATLERDEVCRAIYEQVGRILDTTNFYIALHNEEHRQWETVLDYQEGEKQPSIYHTVDEGLTGYIIRNRLFLLFHNAEEITAFHEQQGLEQIGDPALCWLGVPMIAADRVIGVIGVENYERENVYTEDDLAVLSTVASQAAVALDNARLFEETRRRLQQVNALLEVSRDVATRLDLASLLQSILESAVHIVPAGERGTIQLLDEEAEELVVAAQLGYPDAALREIRFKLDEGFAGWVCREGRADIVVDTQADPRFVMTESSQEIRSMISAPLIGRRGLVGVINLNNLARTAAFGQQDLEFLSGLAHQAAVAIENARLFEERERQALVLEARVRELSALLEGTRAISSTLQLQEVLETLVGVVGRQMDVDTVSLWLVRGDELVPAAASGLPESFMQNVRVRVGEGLTGHVAASGEVYTVADVAAQERDIRHPSGPIIDQQLDLHAYVGVPITYQENVLGVLSVMSGEVRRFTQEEVALLTGLAEQVGIAVENARLFQERERRIAELTALNEVGRAIGSTIRLDELLEVIREEAGRLMDTSNFLVAFYDERADTVSFPVYHEYGELLEQPDRQGGNGLTEYVIRERAPVLINGDSRVFCEAHGIDHRGSPAMSWLGVPLVYLGRVVGIIALQDYEHEDAYDENHVRLLSTIASQAAVAIQNARLFSDLEMSRTELETRLIQLGALQEVGQAVSGTLEIDALLDTVLEAVTSTVGFSYAMISLVDEEEEEVRAERGIGVSAEQIAGSRRTLDSSDIMADIVRTGKTEVIDGWDERFDREMYEELGHANLVRVFAPLVARGKTIGLIEAGYPREIRTEITQDDIEVLQTFLAQASIAIDNARLFEEIRRFSEELERMVEARTRELEDEKNRLEALHAITTELSSTLDLDEILLKTIDLASMATGRSFGMVLLRDLPSGDLVCRAMLDVGNILRPGRQVIPLDQAEALRRIMEEREPLRIDDISADPGLQKRLPELPAGARSVAAVPLVSAEEVVGIILLTHAQAGFFDEEQVRLLTTLGGEVAAAIHNAELYTYINEQALRLAEMVTYQQEEASKVRAILQSVADGVIVVDRASRILLCNPAAAQILSMERVELEGHSTLELPGLFQPGGVLAQGSRRVELPDRFISSHVAPVVTDAGEELGSVYVIRDITREVEADRAKSEFISTVSHELRTPLTSIKGYVDLILLGSVGDVSPMQRSFLDVVRANSNRLVELINDLLDLSRLDTGRIVLNREPIVLSDLLEEVVESARAEIERKQLSLEMAVSPELPTVYVDRKRIVQVLTNMVSNAYKYTPEGGRVEISAHSTDGYVQISVSDTGVGIAKEDMKKLFTRFFRADNPMRDEVGGTGLGLAISKSFVELHGGEMWVESQVGQGSTFTFTLPLGNAGAEEEDAYDNEVHLKGSLGQRFRILVVDDEPHIGELLRYQLERAGYEVLVARRGEEALVIARREHPDLITLDILLAGMDGFEVLEQLKSDERTADIPVVIISIVAEKENLMAMGAVGFLPKPLGEEELLRTLGQILGSSKEAPHVLIADDDPDIVGWLEHLLQNQGCNVSTAADGEEVLNAVLLSPPDLILLDLRMPKLDGREVITRLKLREDTRDIPILVITASSIDRERDRVQILGMGADSFLTKPFSAEELVDEMEQVLRKRMEAALE